MRTTESRVAQGPRQTSRPTSPRLSLLAPKPCLSDQTMELIDPRLFDIGPPPRLKDNWSLEDVNFPGTWSKDHDDYVME